MATEIGLLLGQYEGTQSFESVGSWDLQTTQSSLTLQTTDVHSSQYGARVEVYSGGVGAFQYDYNRTDDIRNRWSLDVTSHRIVSRGWVRIDTAANSGQVTATFSNDTYPIPYSTAFVNYRLETYVSSSANEMPIAFDVSQLSTSSYSFYVDDIMTSVNVFDIHPNWDLSDSEFKQFQNHQTIGGRNSFFDWSYSKVFNMNIEFLTNSEAALLNLWWRDGRALYFCLDTSDTAAYWPVRITNQEAPVQQLMRPYQNAWRGSLKLRGITNSLAF